jgi:transcriptional regulator with XRE-family HTH domain
MLGRMDITAAQCRAARALANLTQDQLADASRVSKRTITHFEAGERQPVPATLAALQRALEAAGVEFKPDGSVRLREQPAEAQAS